MAGKGDKPRPVYKVVYDMNFARIDWSKKKKQEETKKEKKNDKLD